MLCGHPCKKKCNEACGGCDVIVERMLTCGHRTKMKCGKTPERSDCKEPCQRLLPCHHPCGKKCAADCETECKQGVRFMTKAR